MAKAQVKDAPNLTRRRPVGARRGQRSTATTASTTPPSAPQRPPPRRRSSRTPPPPGIDLDPGRPRARRREHRVDDPHRPRPVGEARQPVGCSPRSPRTCRARTPRSSPCSPRRARAAARRSAVPEASGGGGRARWSRVCGPASDPQGPRATPARSAATPPEPAALDVQVVLAPGRDLADEHRPEHAAAVRNMTVARSSVCHLASVAPPALADGRERRGQLAAVVRSGTTVAGLRAHRGDPLAGDELDQVAPVRADVARTPARPALRRVHAPVVVVGVESQSCR